jgi:hypothetical protein
VVALPNSGFDPTDIKERRYKVNTANAVVDLTGGRFCKAKKCCAGTMFQRGNMWVGVHMPCLVRASYTNNIFERGSVFDAN